MGQFEGVNDSLSFFDLDFFGFGGFNRDLEETVGPNRDGSTKV